MDRGDLMREQMTELILHLDPDHEGDAEELEKFSRQLREELMDMDLEAVDFISTGETPEKAKGFPIEWGTLIVALVASGGVITTLINVLKSWLTRQDRRSITLEINGDKLEVSSISSEEQQKLIDLWLSRHSGGVK
jgi:hypothetical protein